MDIRNREVRVMRNAETVPDVLRDPRLTPRLSRRNRWRASCWETSPRGSDRGSLEKDPPMAGTSPAAYRCTGSSVAGLTQDVAIPGWSAASREPC